MSSNAYIYGEDSKLLGEVLAGQEVKESYLEIGVGNGGNLKIAERIFGLVVGTDIFDLTKIKKEFPSAELIVSDRASCFRGEVFDLVAFNPPYVPSDGLVDKTVDGGARGMQIPLLFLESALRVLRRNGKIIMLFSDEGDVSIFADYCSQHSLSTRKIAQRRMFFETLYVYEITSETSR